MKTAAEAWADLGNPHSPRRSRAVALQYEGFWTALAAAHLETGKPYKEAQ